MKRSLVLAAAALAALTLVAAGCGDSDEVPADAVAVVDGTTITRQELDELLARAKKSYTAQKREFPKAGTAEYQSLQTQAVAFLVQREEYAREAEKLDIEVTDAQIDKKLDEVKKQYFANDQKKLEEGLDEQGYTEASLREDIRSQLTTEAIYDDVTKDVKVTDADDPEVLRRRTRRTTPSPSRGRCATSSSRRRRRPTSSSAARGRRRLRGARQAELARPRLEGPGRPAHDHARPDGGAVRQGRVHAEDERALGAGQDRVRVPPDPADRGRQEGLRHAVRAGQGADQARSSTRSGRTRP